MTSSKRTFGLIADKVHHRAFIAQSADALAAAIRWRVLLPDPVREQHEGDAAIAAPANDKHSKPATRRFMQRNAIAGTPPL